MHMEQAVPDLTSPSVYQSPWRGWGPLFRSKQAVLGYSILRESVFWHVLPLLWNRQGSSEKAQTWQTCPSTRVVQGAFACAEIGQFIFVHGAPKMSLPIVFSIIDHIVAYESDAPKSSTICRLRTSIKYALWLISNGWLVAEIWYFIFWGDVVPQN